MLGCGTSNELIGLLADGKASEPEIKWIKANYLIKTYGKKSRVKLTDDELMEFWDYLKNK